MFTPAVGRIILACTIVFLLQSIVRRFFPLDYTAQFQHLFGLVPYYVTRRLYIWQFATYLFLHATIWHLVMNMLFLYFFGMDLERTWGKRRFYEYYFLTGIGAGVIIALHVKDPYNVTSEMLTSLPLWLLVPVSLATLAANACSGR